MKVAIYKNGKKLGVVSSTESSEPEKLLTAHGYVIEDIDYDVVDE